MDRRIKETDVILGVVFAICKDIFHKKTSQHGENTVQYAAMQKNTVYFMILFNFFEKYFSDYDYVNIIVALMHVKDRSERKIHQGG